MTHCRMIAPLVLLVSLVGVPPLVRGDQSSDARAKSEAATKDAKNSDAKSTKPATIARVTLKGSLSESVSPPGIFGELDPNLSTMLSRLEKAAQDKQVSAVVIRLQNPSIGRAKVEELRRAVARLRDAKKQVIAELEMGMTADFLIASACDKIVMPPSGVLMLPGVRAEVSYYKGLLDYLGIQAEMMQVGAFKGAAEPFTRKDMSPEFRAQFESVIDDFYQQMVSTIASDRKLDPAKVRELIDVGMFTATQAKQAGLVDLVVYEDELKAHLKEQVKADDVKLVDNYGKQQVDNDFSGMMGMMKMFELLLGGNTTTTSGSAKKVAVIHAAGVITSGEGGLSLFGESTIDSKSMVKALKEAAEDKTVVAIVLRVDSPGGSALASDLIWRQIRQIEKPIVASMGDTAASGGYYISMGADKIYAEPGTLTGSIGVVSGKIVLKGLYDKLGIHTEVLSRGKNSGLLSSDSPMTEGEREAMRGMMEEVYRQFVSKAAEGRKLTEEKLEPLAGGRIWSGRQAKERGLVDELGGLKDAVAAAKQLGGMKADEKVELLHLPKAKSFLDQLLEGEASIRTPVTQVSDRSLPGLLRNSMDEIRAVEQLFSDPRLYLLPYRIQIR